MDPSLPPQRSTKNNPSPKPNNQAECPAFYICTFVSFLLLITIQSLAIQNTTTNTTPPSRPTLQPLHPKRSIPPSPLTFHPLKDPTVPPYTDPNRTWFMSTLTGRSTAGMPEHFLLPSHRSPHRRILCVDPRNKSYALASPGDAFPARASSVAGGLTFVADSFYDYENPWHGLNAVAPFFSWMREGGRCEWPRRWVMFRNGEVVRRVGRWVSGVMEAVLGGGGEVVLEGLEGGGVVCFERAVVFRRGVGGMDGGRRHGVFEMVRCKAWRHCGVRERGGGESSERVVRISLVGREGRKRGFKNESGVREVMERECEKVRGCSFRLIHFHNMTFCNQVRAMRDTDVLASTHGAQLTNMVFMPKGSSVMEMFPAGWLEGAGVGQFIYQWFASWSEMHYEGAWRDTDDIFNCSYPPAQRSKCFSMQKDRQVGLNETYLAGWTAEVIRRSLRRKHERASTTNSSIKCSCDED